MDRPALPPAAAPKRFRLTRHFSLTSLVGIVVVMVSLLVLYRALTEQHLVAHEGRANADLTRVFANAVWQEYRGFVVGSAGRTREQLLADPAVARLRADVLDKMRGLPIAKIKVYNRDGVTVFSTDPDQIGQDKSANDGFRQARSGVVASQITFRERFDAFEGTLNNRNLLASYVPVRSRADGQVEGVFEVYSDVTELLAEQQRAQWQVAGLVLGLLALLYLFLLVVVRKADGVIAERERERDEREAQVRHQAYHDALTGLPNRGSFAEQLATAITQAQRHGHVCALLFVDLDRFKLVNDTLGHAAGDALLRHVSARIAGCLRDGDLLFRMGGDEFTILLPRVAGPEDAAALARRVVDAVSKPMTLHQHEVSVGATLGIAFGPGDGDDADTMLRNADGAMYRAKLAGRGGYAFSRAAPVAPVLPAQDIEATA